MENETAVNRLLDQLVGMGALPDVRDEETGERNHGAIVMRVLEGLRPSVLRFAWFMETRLRENDHKGGWIGYWEQDAWGAGACDLPQGEHRKQTEPACPLLRERSPGTGQTPSDGPDRSSSPRPLDPVAGPARGTPP